MTYQEANSISIKDYLESLGILPVVDKLYYGMYHSPLRQDDTPSFKVDYGVNLWCDFGTGEGGSLIDLVMKQHGCNAYGAICRLEQGNTASFSFAKMAVPSIPIHFVTMISIPGFTPAVEMTLPSFAFPTPVTEITIWLTTLVTSVCPPMT